MKPHFCPYCGTNLTECSSLAEKLEKAEATIADMQRDRGTLTKELFTLKTTKLSLDMR